MRVLHRILASAALISTVIGSIPAGVVLGQPHPVYTRQAATDLVAEVNALRAAQTLQPYRIDPILMAVAQAQADFMATSGVATHFDAAGARPFQRAISAGYPVAGDLAIGGKFSEDIYVGSNKSVQQVIAIWQADPVDLDSLISPALQDVGAGVATADGLTYYVLDAGAAAKNLSATSTLGDDIIPSATAGTQLPPIATSTALENGDVYHQVQPREALWSIALAYGTSVEQIKLLNALATDQIFTGQILLIRKAILPTLTATTQSTATFGIPSSTSTKEGTPTITSSPTEAPVAPATFEGGREAVLFIVLITLLAAGVGAWLGRKKST